MLWATPLEDPGREGGVKVQRREGTSRDEPRIDFFETTSSTTRNILYERPVVTLM